MVQYVVVSLQGIGLSLEEALIFWRSEFTKLMDVDKVILKFDDDDHSDVGFASSNLWKDEN